MIMTAFNIMESKEGYSHYPAEVSSCKEDIANKSSSFPLTTSKPLPMSISVLPGPSPSALTPAHRTARIPNGGHRRVHSRKLRKSAIADDICRVFGVFFALFVRIVLTAFSVFTVWLLVNQLEDDRFWTLSLTNLLMIFEGIYTIVSRSGQERKWLCLCFVCYLLSCVPPIWFLELQRLDIYKAKYANSSSIVTLSVTELSAVIQLDVSLALHITEQCLVFLLILCRWLLPRGEISRDMLSQLLFVFIGMASDVMEVLQLFNEPEVRHDEPLIYAILTIWTVSLFQFTLVMTMSINPKKAVNSHDLEVKDTTLNKILHTEVWSLVATIFMQDGPFLIVRLYVLLSYRLANYSIIFFTCKNVLVVSLLFYRFIVICLRKFGGGSDDDDDDDDNDDDDEDNNKNNDTERGQDSRMGRKSRSIRHGRKVSNNTTVTRKVSHNDISTK